MALIRGGTVLPHVQAFADAVSAFTGADSFGTYPGHEPTEDRAVDIFVPVNSDTLGNKICAFALANITRFGIDYVIYRQRIFNPPERPYWRQMEDRGGVTQNHFDHVHVSFEATAPGPFGPQGDDDMTAEEHQMLVNCQNALDTLNKEGLVQRVKNIEAALARAEDAASNTPVEKKLDQIIAKLG